MQTKKTKVTLLSWTQYPLETIHSEWIQSRTNDPVPMPWVTNRALLNPGEAGQALRAEVRETFHKVIDMKMPLGEHIQFIFMLENCPVALREQLVRHRIGHKFGDRLGADIVPDLAGSSSFWSQTTRIINMGKFATDRDYLAPAWLEEHPDHNDYYHNCMLMIQDMYRNLVKFGMPLEDARNILPVAMQHRLTWNCNLASLMHVLSRRGCWLAQLGMWEPVIHGITEELALKIDPYFRRLIDPPCFDSKGNYTQCAFGKENEEIAGPPYKGEYPPCSLWVNNDACRSQSTGEKLHEIKAGGFVEETVVGSHRLPRYDRMQEKYATLWGRNPRTGERVQLA